MTKAVLNIRLLEPADWRLLRDTRLRALRESPHAFTSRHCCEQLCSAEQWKERVTAANWLVAVEGGIGIGIAGLVPGHLEEPEHVESIWVAPTHRNRGVFRSLLSTMIEIARGAHLKDLWLWVLEDNLLAWHVYGRLGFVATGERKPIEPGHVRIERRMRLVL
jgi:ribosomal protein S18 acetylase RimI-like enzyme